MPGMHVGGSFHDPFHPTEVRPPEVRPPSGSTRGGSSDIAGSPQSATSHSVLRLRGGGNTQGSGEKGGDRENLLPGGAGSSSHGMYHGTQSRSETQRAKNEVKRYELQGRLDDATRERDAARAGRERAVTDLDRITAAIKDLDDRKRHSGSDPARLSEIEGQLQTAHADFWQKTREVGDYTKALRTSDDNCRRFERKLHNLTRT
ncbi:MAG TPA: hypothetical protein VGN31_09060 [Paraburkholderia sp.]